MATKLSSKWCRSGQPGHIEGDGSFVERAILCIFCDPPTYWAPEAMYYIHKRGKKGKCKKCKYEANKVYYRTHVRQPEWVEHKRTRERTSALDMRKRRTPAEREAFNRARRLRYRKQKRTKFIERLVQLDNERSKK